MSEYTQEELQGMSRVQLRRAAIEVLKIDNKEASNSKSGDLIDRILETQGGGGDEEEKPKSSSKPKSSGRGKARSSTKASSRSSTKAKDDEPEASASSNGVGELVDAVGKAVDETKEELTAKVDEVLENQEHIMKQQFILFGLLTDVYKAVDEPDALEDRLNELEEEWSNQGNE